MTKVHILLPVHNRREITRSFVQCLLAQTHTDYHLVLIDDGSNDGTEEMVRAQVGALTVLKGKGDWWWAGSLQQGFNYLKERGIDAADVVLIINDDVKFESDYLERAVRAISGRQGILLLSRYKTPDGLVAESGVHADLRQLTFNVAESADKINCLSTRGLFLHWRDFQKVGDFHPKLLPHYLSDYEFTIRAYRKGLQCETSSEVYLVSDPETTGYHKIEEKSFRKFVSKFFSKRSAVNPIYWTVFIIIVSERAVLARNLVRFWRDALRTILRAYRISRAASA